MLTNMLPSVLTRPLWVAPAGRKNYLSVIISPSHSSRKPNNAAATRINVQRITLKRDRSGRRAAERMRLRREEGTG